LIGSAELRERQGARSFERIHHYDFDGFAKRLLEFVEALP
jgi:hypothetical protein